MSKSKYVKVYNEYVPVTNRRAPERIVPASKDDTFRNLLFQYSCDRMDTDPNYRRDVRRAVAARRKANAPRDQKAA